MEDFIFNIDENRVLSEHQEPYAIIEFETEKEFNRELELRKLIKDYGKKHESAKMCGGEYIYQNDNAQSDAIDLVCKIFDLYVEDSD